MNLDSIFLSILFFILLYATIKEAKKLLNSAFKAREKRVIRLHKPNYKGFDKKRLAKWSRAVKKRDKKCMCCNTKHSLEAHHIKPKSKYKRLAYSLDNGVALCRRCHRTGFLSYHSIMGINGNKIQFYVWLFGRKLLLILLSYIIYLLVVVFLAVRIHYN